jgi:predicted ATPase
MITKIEIDGFKSFRNFEMDFSPFVVVAGLNASGKSNLFDALELLSRLAVMPLREAFSQKRGNIIELFSQAEGDAYADKMRFSVELLVEKQVKDNWGQEAIITAPRMRYTLSIGRRKDAYGIDELFVSEEELRKIPPGQDLWAKLHLKKVPQRWKNSKGGGTSKPFIQTEDDHDTPTITMRQDGRQGRKATPVGAIHQTVLSSVNSVDFPHVFAAKEEMRKWKFMQLNPERLREPTRQEPGMRYHISHDGANLAAALHRMKQHDEEVLIDIAQRMVKFLPEFVRIDVEDDKANRQFVIKLTSKDKKTFTSRVLSEGTLRLLTLIVMACDDEHQGLLCFEEPENGVHFGRIGQVVALLADLATGLEDADEPLRQVIVNTHSPLLIQELQRKYRNQEATDVTVWLSRMARLAEGPQEHRHSFSYTKMDKAKLTSQHRIALDGEQDGSWTTADLTNYLKKLDGGAPINPSN